MPLSKRQQRFYVYAADIWRQAASPPAGADYGAYALLAAAVPCHFGSRQTSDRAGPLGRGAPPATAEADVFHFALAVDVGDTDMVHLVAVPNGSPDLGGWWSVLGEPSRAAFRANRVRVVARRSLPPPGAA